MIDELRERIDQARSRVNELRGVSLTSTPSAPA